jgi:hypothetical protein
MPTYVPEVLYVDRDGKEYPAKIVGYGQDGKVAPEYTGERVSAAAASLEGVEVLAQKIDPMSGAVSEDYVAIEDCKAIVKYGYAYSPDGGKKTEKKIPVLDLLVNVGSGKRGEIWNFVPTVARSDDQARGGSVLPKPYWKTLPKKEKKKEKDSNG